MKTEQMIEELHKIANKHKNDVVGVGELNLHAMCMDVAKRLQELLEKSGMSEWIPLPEPYNPYNPNTCKNTECPFYCPKQDCVAKEGCGGYTNE